MEDKTMSYSSDEFQVANKVLLLEHIESGGS